MTLKVKLVNDNSMILNHLSEEEQKRILEANENLMRAVAVKNGKSPDIVNEINREEPFWLSVKIVENGYVCSIAPDIFIPRDQVDSKKIEA